MDRGAWWATVHAVAKSRTQLSDFTFTFTLLSFTDLFFTNFLQIEGLRQPCQASLLVPFFQQYLLIVSISHLVILSVFQPFIITVTVISDL